MSAPQNTRLLELLSIPTSPFREILVMNFLERELREAKVPCFADEFGNLIAGADSLAEYRRKISRTDKEPVRLFIAHTDHPGFHGARWLSSTELQVRWHGGSPTQDLIDAKVWLANDRGEIKIAAKMREATLAAHGKAIDHALILFESPPFDEKKLPAADSIFGGFAFRAPVWLEGEKIYTKAADDLIGCYAMLETARFLWKRKNPLQKNFLALFTRAEEVGFIGAIAHFAKMNLAKSKRQVLAVSLETSRALPGAEIGQGPIVRLGDRASMFSNGPLQTFEKIAQKNLPGNFQKRIMDGGSCEATAAVAFGLPAIGISVPLGNYHNQCLEGGPDSRGPMGPAPEFVNQSDLNGMLKLCVALLEPNWNWKDPWSEKQKELRAALEKYRPLLEKFPI